jgi:hypothetical protein
MVLRTPHAEAAVLGTRLVLTVLPAASRLEVEQGRVRFARRNDGAAIEVAAGQFASTDAAASVRIREHARGPDVLRLIDDFEGALRWYHVNRSAPVEFTLSSEVSHTPRLSLLLSFQPRPDDPDARGALVHPVRILSSDRFLRFHVRVAEAAGKPEWSVSLREKDGDHWHLGSGSFEQLPTSKGWNIVDIPLPDGAAEMSRGGEGDGRYDPAEVESFSLSLGGGKVVFFLDTILAVEANPREVLFPNKPGRAGD